MAPIRNQGKIYYRNGQIGYIPRPYEYFTKGMLNAIYTSDESEKGNDEWVSNAENDPDRYKQVVKIELIYNNAYPVTHFAEQVFTNQDTKYYLSRIITYMPNLKEIKIGEGFGNFERGKCFMGLGYVEKIDLPSTFRSVGGIEDGDYFMVDMANLETLILRNPTPPEFYSASGARITPEDSFKRLGHTVVYVPDAAVETYKSNPVFADLNIQPLSSYQESDKKTVFPGKVKGKFEINGKEIRKFYINGVEYYNISEVIGVKKNYIEFADNEVKRLCVENWGSNGEITYDQAAAVTDLGGVFSGNTAITSFDELQYFTGLQGICQDAFYNCSALTSVTIPDSVTTISGGAFSSCKSLTSIDIPTGVTFIGSRAFSTCSNLTSITIPNGVTNISNDTFFSCRALTSVTIPDNVIRIGQNAFYNCSALTSITIPTGVTTIEMNTFKGCSGLTSIIIPDSVTSIGNNAFQDCSGLTSITIPTGVTSIGTQAFRNCSGFASITSLALTAPEIAVNTFQDVSSGGTLYVPSGATGYNVWMKKGPSFLGIFYLGNYNWTLSRL